MLQKAKRAPVQPQDRCQAGTLKGEQCANRVWLKCTTANLCCKHDPIHPSYKHPELDEVRKTQTKKQTKNERRQNPNLQPVPEDAKQLYKSSMRAQGTPVPITSDSEAESVVAKEPEFCEICCKWGGPFRQCNFCGDRPSRHHGRCCEHNPDNRYPPSGDDYPTPPTPTPVVWHVSSHHSNDDVESADVDMRGKRKRTIEESEVEEVPVVQAMDNHSGRGRSNLQPLFQRRILPQL